MMRGPRVRKRRSTLLRNWPTGTTERLISSQCFSLRLQCLHPISPCYCARAGSRSLQRHSTNWLKRPVRTALSRQWFWKAGRIYKPFVKCLRNDYDLVIKPIGPGGVLDKLLGRLDMRLLRPLPLARSGCQRAKHMGHLIRYWQRWMRNLKPTEGERQIPRKPRTR